MYAVYVANIGTKLINRSQISKHTYIKLRPQSFHALHFIAYFALANHTTRHRYTQHISSGKASKLASTHRGVRSVIGPISLIENRWQRPQHARPCSALCAFRQTSKQASTQAFLDPQRMMRVRLKQTNTHFAARSLLLASVTVKVDCARKRNTLLQPAIHGIKAFIAVIHSICTIYKYFDFTVVGIAVWLTSKSGISMRLHTRLHTHTGGLHTHSDESSSRAQASEAAMLAITVLQPQQQQQQHRIYNQHTHSKTTRALQISTH